MIEALLKAQNPDGGWGIHPGAKSWTEPTLLATLALGQSAPSNSLSWLRQAQSSDGNWQSAPQIGQPNWLCALAALLPPNSLGTTSHQQSINAIRAAVQPLPHWSERLRQWMLGIKPPKGPIARGWSWVPGTAPWLIPTAFSVMALRKAATNSDIDRALIEQGTNYLFTRQCEDGGWNHGASRALGYEAPSYPETTGIALVALKSIKNQKLDKALNAAARHARGCQTWEGAFWLRLALHIHNQPVIFEPPARSRLDNRELAIAAITESCLKGEPLLWQS